MGIKEITPGDKLAKAVGSRFIKSKSGTSGIEVAFEFWQNDAKETLNWVAWLSEKALKNSLEILDDVLGCSGNDLTDSNGVFVDPKFLDYGREVKLVVELESYINENGEARAYPKIKWVNKAGGSQYSGVSPEIVKAELAAVGFKAAFLAAKKSQIPNMADKFNSKDELPF